MEHGHRFGFDGVFDLQRGRVEGGRRLAGKLSVEGNKNSALPLIAACLLTAEECVLENVPRIRDVGVLLDLLRGLGADVEGQGSSTLRIRCAAVNIRREGWASSPPPSLYGWRAQAQICSARGAGGLA